MAGLIFASGPSLMLFAGCWTMLSLPAPAVRGIRAAFFAKHVDQKRLVEVGNKASAFGLVGGFSGPLLAAILTWTRFPFEIASCICAVVFFMCAVLIATFMTGDRHRDTASSKTDNARKTAFRPRVGSGFFDERCSVLGCGGAGCGEEKALCRECLDNYQRKGISFWWYSARVMVGCWSFVLLLEISLNAGVMVAFQPVVVTHFGWSSSSIALVNTAGAAFGVLILLVLTYSEPGERAQASYAAACYLGSVVLFMSPPLAEWRLVAGVMLGMAAQLVLYPALEAMFAHKLGKVRVTVGRAVLLSLASSVGTAMGTALAPLVVARAGSGVALLAAAPALLATIGVSVLGCKHRRPAAAQQLSSTKPLLEGAV